MGWYTLYFYISINTETIYSNEFLLFSALVLASPEIRFQVDSETHDPIEVEVKKMRETNSMVEEFMLLANVSVAEKIEKEFPEFAMLRRHPEPPQNNFDPLIKAGRNQGRFIYCIKYVNIYTIVDHNLFE